MDCSIIDKSGALAVGAILVFAEQKSARACAHYVAMQLARTVSPGRGIGLRKPPLPNFGGLGAGQPLTDFAPSRHYPVQRCARTGTQLLRELRFGSAGRRVVVVASPSCGGLLVRLSIVTRMPDDGTVATGAGGGVIRTSDGGHGSRHLGMKRWAGRLRK